MLLTLLCEPALALVHAAAAIFSMHGLPVLMLTGSDVPGVHVHADAG